jgi:5'-deoxynucleotidase YfbR-like HD superfamily hydrolase
LTYDQPAISREKSSQNRMQILNLEQLKLALRLHRVRRFQTHHLLEPMSVAEHSFRVGALYSFLGGKELLPAMAHDLEEAITGDLPSPIKKDLTGLEKYEALRPQFIDAEEKKLGKLADKLDLLLHIRNQVKYSDDLMEIYDTELETVMELAAKLQKTKEVKKLIKEIR